MEDTPLKRIIRISAIEPSPLYISNYHTAPPRYTLQIYTTPT